MSTHRRPAVTALAGLLVGGVLGATVAVSTPAGAGLSQVVQAKPGKTVKLARYARNADKVDGLHAVAAGASTPKRRGKLVATNGAGKLPDDIIAKAPDADRLDGVDGSAYRFIPLDLGAGLPVGDTVSTYRTGAFGGGGINVPDTSGNRFGWAMVLPPSFPTGATLTIRLQWHIDQTGCTIDLRPNSATHERPGLVVANSVAAAAGLAGGGAVTVPAVAETTVETVLTASPTRTGTQFQKLDSYAFSLFRATSDTCTEPLVVSGVSVTY